MGRPNFSTSAVPRRRLPTHVEISGVVKVGSNQPFFCSVSPTLEVFDSVTGATTAILGTSSLPQLRIVRGLVQPQDGEVDQPPTR